MLSILTANFFPSIGKGRMGVVASLSRQVLFLLPLIVIFPMIWGIEGVLLAGPIADAAAGSLAIILLLREVGRWKAS